MVICICKCLNVTLESDKIEDNVDIAKLELSSMEQRDIFFSEKLLSCAPNSFKFHVEQPALVAQLTIGRWTLHSCLACGQTTHAMIQDKNGLNLVLIAQSLQTTQDRINMLKKSKTYSPVFNLLVPEVTNDIEMKENVDTSNLIASDKTVNPPMHQVIGTLSKHMNQTLQAQLEAVEETVRQFRDQKYAEYEAYKERAQRDHKILASIVNKAHINMDNSWNTDTTLQNGPSSPQLPPLQRRRLSSIKDAKKIPQNIVKAHRNLPPEDDSLDAEDLFDLEGMDSRNHNMISDLEDYESDDGSDDEGIQIARPRGGGGSADIARSLPMMMPGFPSDRSNPRELDADDYEEPQDIAASIKALARSVHGDVFELPRPRFSTQI